MKLDPQTFGEEMLRAYRKDPIVFRAVHDGATAEQLIVALVAQKDEMLKRVIELESIAPRRIKTPDGDRFWHCPDHLIPTTRSIE